MLPATNTSSAQAIASPDVCLTPPSAEPIPYANVAQAAMAVNTAANVLTCALPTVTTASTVPSSEGDESGSMSTNSGPGLFVVGQPNVLVNGAPAVTLTTPTSQNSGVAAGTVTVPSVTNVLINFDAAPARAALLHDELARAEVRVVEAAEATILAFDVLAAGAVASARGHVARRPADRPIVLDLRGCRGGDLHAALALAAAFLPPGTVLLRVVERDGDETVHTSHGGAPFPNPLVALVDRRAASAAEALVAALGANDRALVVGERTYGKGLVERFEGDARRAVGVTARRDGQPIEGAGVAPDLEAHGADALPAALALAALFAP